MSYQSEIYDAVCNSIALNKLFGDRFSWDIADNSTPVPFVVAQTISDSGRGDLQGDRGLGFPLIQFSTWAKTKDEALKISETIRVELEGIQLPGDAAVVLTFQSEHSTYDPDARLFGNVMSYYASFYLHAPNKP